MDTPTKIESQLTNPRNRLKSNVLESKAGLENMATPQWFAMRDLKRPNAKLPAYRQLANSGFDVFTPMQTRITLKAGRHIRQEVPFMRDLLFVRSTRTQLDPVVEKTPTLQYRYIKGAYRQPMTVRASDMHAFITAVSQQQQPRYVSPEEITPDMYGQRVRVVCNGPMNGYEGYLLRVKGSAKRRILIEIPGLLGLILELASASYLQLL